MMPAPKPTTTRKTRSSTPRARTGCSTCRTRHVKCDETRPSCLKCIKAGWKCDGYPAQPNPPKSNGALENSPQSLVVAATKSLNITSYSIPFRIPGSQKDRQILHYFCVQGASDISGFLPSEFWSQTVLQHSHREPVVRQALVALSSLHLDYVTADSLGAEVAGPETLLQYGRALRALHKRLASPGQDATKLALVCCILFYCFESTVGNAEAAMRHLDNGLQVLSSTQEGPIFGAQGSAGDIEALSGILARLDLQASLFDDGRVPILSLTSDSERENGIGGLNGDRPFSNLQTAQTVLDRLQNWLIRLLTTNASCYRNMEVEAIPCEILEEKQCLDTAAARWRQKFALWCATNETADEKTLCWTQMLRINYQITDMMLAATIPDDEAMFSANPNLVAHEILDRVASVIELAKQKDKTADAATNARRNFASENGVIIPLFLLAVKCSDELVFERASQMLAVCNRREGLYDAASMVEVLKHLSAVKAERKLALEKQGVKDVGNTSLENWAPDLINERDGGMDMIGKSTSRTLAPP
ncbi:hypothetical protein EDB81DRAFT_802900 [Dactylonectria macrodidyma]|uniref:Zn(2)-C6 fungal-type domain-containing protein n=1 Tax=Dactylonectria macrodidyma TaxID=307937 RepID=A0A9P9EAT8_9HYPO|nr:hypothetical protein EDB81DRAFT_802900 [Dactylonectria macrodidyma]